MGDIIFLVIFINNKLFIKTMVEDEDVAAEEPSKDCELITVAVSESSVSYWKSLFITTVVDKGLWPSGTT